MRDILVICGPTASGKTSLAINIAKEIILQSSLRAKRGNPVSNTAVHILSADSRQIYRGLDIVTGKDLPAHLPTTVKFFGLDLVGSTETFNLSDYVHYAQKVIQESLAKNIPLIIVGGTGLYLKALTSDLLNVNVPPDEKLRQRLEKLDLESLKNTLLKINPEKFHALNHSDAHNPRRLIRAIEIASSPVTIHPPAKVSLPDFYWVGLSQDKETQTASIRHRVIERLETGALSEVADLIKKDPHHSSPLFTGLGVKQITAYLEQKISYRELIDLWTAAENDYARRQMVWFQKQPDIIWYDKSKVTDRLVQKLVKIIYPNEKK